MPAGGAGRQVDEEISGAGLASSQAAEIVITAATSGGFVVSAVGPTQYRMSRTYRPGWVVPAAIAGVVFFGLGLLLLLLVPKRNETCLATIHDGPQGVEVRLSGVLSEPAIEAIRLDLTRGVSLSPAVNAPAVAHPGHSPRTPIPTRHTQGPSGPVDATRTRSSPAAWGEVDNPSVKIGGEVVPIGAGVVIGRNPAGIDGLPGARLVPVGDPALSKTHLAIRAEGSAVEVCDLSSTNGTVVERSGVPRPCVARVWQPVPSGATIVAGEQRITAP